MLVVLIPGVLLYGLALEAAWRREPGPRVDAESWQSVFAVFAVFLNAIWLTLLFRWVGAHGALITIPALGLTAASAAYAAWRANVRFAALLAALGIVVAWLALWNKLLHPPADTNRWLLLIVGVGLVAAAASLARRGRREANELVTAAGAAGVLAASAGVFVDLLGFSVNRVVRAVGLAHSVGGLNVKTALRLGSALAADGRRADRVRLPRSRAWARVCRCGRAVRVPVQCRRSDQRPARGPPRERHGHGLAAGAARDRRNSAGGGFRGPASGECPIRGSATRGESTPDDVGTLAGRAGANPALAAAAPPRRSGTAGRSSGMRRGSRCSARGRRPG